MYGLKKNIYVCWYEARFSYQMRFVLFKSDVTGVISKICSSNSFEAPDTSGFQVGFERGFQSLSGQTKVL